MEKYSGKEEQIRNYLFSEKDKTLIRLFADESVTAHDVSILTDSLDPDTGNIVFMLSLGVLGFQKGFQYFPEEIVPRLKGLHRYYQVRNSAAAPWFQNQLSILNKEKIPAMLTGGTAMRAYYAPGIPRLMNGYDVTVPEEYYDKALYLLRDSVRNAEKDKIQDHTINGLSVIHLHKGIPNPKLANEQELWNRARTFEFLNNNIRVPSAEDMLLYLLLVPYGPWVMLEDHPDRSRRMIESCIVLKQEINYNILSDIIKMIGQLEPTAFYLRTLENLVPGIIPPETLKLFFCEKNYSSYLTAFSRLCETTKVAEAHKKAGSNSIVALTDRTKLHFARKKMLNILSKA